jgi:hypothetical protein
MKKRQKSFDYSLAIGMKIGGAEIQIKTGLSESMKYRIEN